MDRPAEFWGGNGGGGDIGDIALGRVGPQRVIDHVVADLGGWHRVRFVPLRRLGGVGSVFGLLVGMRVFAGVVRLFATMRLAALGVVMGESVALGTRFVARPSKAARVADRNAIIVGMDFVEGQKTVAVAAVFDVNAACSARLDPGYLGEIDIAFDLPLDRGFEIIILEAMSNEKGDPTSSGCAASISIRFAILA